MEKFMKYLSLFSDLAFGEYFVEYKSRDESENGLSNISKEALRPFSLSPLEVFYLL